ncbi:MAG: hypothetical protein KatS3mg105_4951 [Gemmatales bacterium]|nr:MAG: hypothetical protein KatS3mg105_4951 [Gemmatales bacterium]
MAGSERVIASSSKQDVVIKEYHVDDSSWPWSTLLNLVPHDVEAEHNPGRDEAMEVVFKLIMEDASVFGLTNVFSNPVSCVTAKKPSNLFFREARKAQARWFRQVRDILGSSGRVKRTVRDMTPVIRQLSHTGVLVVDGKHVLPNQWPDRRDEQKLRNVTGHQFGRLLVVQMLKRSSCLCRCDCGQETVVRRSHLINGSTRSCGCLKDEFEARQKRRKDQRRWIHSGQLRPQD